MFPNIETLLQISKYFLLNYVMHCFSLSLASNGIRIYFSAGVRAALLSTATKDYAEDKG